MKESIEDVSEELISRIDALKRQATSARSQQRKEIGDLRKDIGYLRTGMSEGWQWGSVGLGTISVVLGAHALWDPSHDPWLGVVLLVGAGMGYGLVLYEPISRVKKWVRRNREH